MKTTVFFQKNSNTAHCETAVTQKQDQHPHHSIYHMPFSFLQLCATKKAENKQGQLELNAIYQSSVYHDVNLLAENINITYNMKII